MLRATLILFACGALAGCLRSTQFQCENDSACGAGGKCEASRFCSFADPGCASGRVYGDSAGANAGKCTDENMQQVDAAVDSPTLIDARGDGPSNCPQDFTMLANAGPHVYKAITTADTWTAQQAACRQLSNNQAYLSVPDNIGELTATDALTGVGPSYWVGISDIQQEGVYKRVYDNAVQGYLPWDAAAGEPDDTMGGQDCVDSHTALHKIYTDKCTDQMPAVCECDP
jgi:hypothetical protein